MPLTQGYEALISRRDSRLLADKWYVARCGGGKMYARRDGQGMHRIIMAAELRPGAVVDHINGNTLDNRRENLRVVSHATNNRNRAAYTNPSGYRGVNCHTGKFAARIAKVYLGFFETAIEAAFAVNQHLDKIDGDIGYRNKIDFNALLEILRSRRAAIEEQIAVVERARR